MAEETPQNIYDVDDSGTITNETGEELDLDTFFSRYSEVAIRVARKILDYQEAQFAAAAALHKVWRGKEKYDPGGGRSLESYVAKAADWAAHNVLRDGNKQLASAQSLDAMNMPMPSSTASPERQLIDKEGKAKTKADIKKVMESLARPDRVMIVMRFKYGLTYQEIADRMSKHLSRPLTADAVRKRLARNLDRIRGLMKRYGYI